MKNFNMKLVGIAMAIIITFSSIGQIKAATAVDLGAADDFAVLAGSGITNTGTTVITGDVGSYPTLTQTGFETVTINGTNHFGDATAQQAKTDLVTAYNDAAGQGGASAIVADLGGQTLTAGVYNTASSIGLTGTLTLDGEGDANAVFIFQAGSTLTTASGSNVALTNGAQACNIFWQIGSSATLGTTSDFKGNILAMDSITDDGGSTIVGRILARNAAVTLNNTIVNATCAGAEPATLNVIKAVTNDNGGSATASSFNLYVKLDGANVVGSPAAGAATPGTSYSLDAGTYVVSEDINALYTQSFSGDCDAGGNVTLAPGDDKTCTITNNDIPATINVVKTVINDDGGNSSVGDFPLFVNSTSVVSGVTNTFAAPASYTVSETADSDYTQVFSGDCDANGVINLVPGDNKFCIITNNDINRPVSGGGGFITMPDPPLIDVIKVPNPLALPGGPGLVEYTYTVKNIGTVPMIDVTLVGDSCSPIILTSGDSNFNQRLEVTETWVYTCSTTLTETHTNNVVATGWHYGLSSVDIASATVIVGLPVVPPLIHVTKVPSPLSLLAGGGMVTYTKQVTNPGTVPLSNVRLTDDVCNPVVYISGDANGDSLLDPAETWVYTCSVNLNQTTVNTVIASGDANGLTARDIAVATVVVAGAVVVPQLPDTGFFTRSGITLWNIVILGSVALALAALGLYRKRQV